MVGRICGTGVGLQQVAVNLGLPKTAFYVPAPQGRGHYKMGSGVCDLDLDLGGHGAIVDDACIRAPSVYGV